MCWYDFDMRMYVYMCIYIYIFKYDCNQVLYKSWPGLCGHSGSNVRGRRKPFAMGVWRDESSSSDDDLELTEDTLGSLGSHILRIFTPHISILTYFPSCLTGAYAISIWLCALRTQVHECSGLLDSHLPLLGLGFLVGQPQFLISKVAKPQCLQGMQGFRH